MGHCYPPPDNEDAFEQMCLRFYRKLWNNGSLMLYGKRGERQDGVDIHDPVCLKPVRAVQCKHRESTKTLQPAELKAEVAKAERSKLPIEHYVIATTAKKTRAAQDTVAELNSRPVDERKFTVELHFWDDICELLGSFKFVQATFIVAGQDVRDDVIASVLQEDPDLVSVVSRLLGVSGENSPSEAFSEIEQLLEDRNFDAARHELDKLPCSDELKTLSKADQYKVLRLRAKLALETGQFEIASQSFLAGYEVQPDLDQAKQNRVLAFSLIRDSQRAFELASQYVAAGLTTPVMLGRLIENASTLEQIDKHMSLIEPHFTTSEDINIALCHKLLQFGNSVSAAEAAGRAVNITQDSPHAQFAAALPLHNAAIKGDWTERKSRLQLALTHYNAAEKGARQKKFTNLLPEVLINRAAAHMLLGDTAAAAADYRAAVDAANTPALYAACAVSFHLHQQEYESAWKLLELLDNSGAEGRFLTAATEFHSTVDEEERRRHLEQMTQLAEDEWPRAVECRLHCVSFALLLKDPTFARSCITDAFRANCPFQAFIALAWISLVSDDGDAALEYADNALEQVKRDAHPQELRLLADILTKLHQHAKALDLLEQIALPGILNDDTKQLIICAQRLERHDLLLRICRELRETGEQDDNVRRLELQLLRRYSPEQGLALVDQFIQASSTPTYFVAFKNVLALGMSNHALLQLDVSQLPTPSELTPEESRLVTLPYVTVGKFDDALRFLYAQLRAYFDHEHAHAQFVFFFLTYGDNISLRSPSMEVGPNCSVLLDIDGGTTRWATIEDDNPLPSRSEFSQNSELGQRLIGRTAGDVIELPGNLVQTEKATIREIQTKYVRAFQDSLEHFRARFPETSLIQQLKLGSGDAFDPAPIIESLTERREYVESCIEFYNTNPCPLHLFAAKMGISELNAIKALAQHPATMLKCCQTTPRDYEHAVREGLKGDLVVLDISAIVTLTLADAWSQLDSHRRYLVSRATKELVEQWLSDASAECAREGGHASVTEDGRFVYHEVTKEQRKDRFAEVENIKNLIDKTCECRSSEAVAMLSPEKRNSYEEVLGFHNVESMSLAKDLNAVLWSDDLVLSIIANAEYEVITVWTQLALQCFVDKGLVTIDDFNLVSAKLASWGYTTILWKPETIIRAGEHADWTPQQWPFKQCIELIAKSTLSLPDKARIACQCLKLLRSSRCSELRQSAVIQEILTAVGNRRAVGWMLKQVDHVFGIDVSSAVFMRLEIEFWLGTHLH